MTPRRIVLVGFMGAGKSVVGRELAVALDWRFRDLDSAIEARTGLPVGALFDQFGEASFRQLEARVGQEIMGSTNAVISTGGGWPCAPGRLESLGPESLSVWLVVSPEEAVRRARDDSSRRPLLEVDDPLAAARALLTDREAYYEKAMWSLDSESADPADLARRLVRHVNDPELGAIRDV